MKTTIIPFASVLLASCLLTGCVAYTSYTGELKPVSPKPHPARFFAPVRVDSLHPTFKWEGAQSTDRVDLIIWAAEYDGFGFHNNSGSYTPGAVVYYRTNIVGNKHKIEKDLVPNATYFWSCRLSGTTPWLTADHHDGFGGSIHTDYGCFFSIRTPSHFYTK